MPRGVPRAGFKRSRATGLPLGQASKDPLLNPAGHAGTVMTREVEGIPDNDGSTDDQIRQKLKERFDTLGIMAKATVKGVARAVIVSGPPGLGKSYDVERHLIEAGSRLNVRIIKGYLSARGLYRVLFESKAKGQVLVFDDADAVFQDEVGLNLLKTACDTTEVRHLSWLTDKTDDDMPNEFDYEGGIVFITNIDFDKMVARQSRSAPHFEALMSRAHYLDMALKTKQDYIVRIKQVVESGMLRERGLSKNEAALLIGFIEENRATMRSLSLREVVKLCDLFQAEPNEWQMIAKQTLTKQNTAK